NLPGGGPAPARGARGGRRGQAGRALASRLRLRPGADAHRRAPGAAHLDPDREPGARDPGRGDRDDRQAAAGAMSQAPREVYADHAATTRPAPEVVAAMTPYLGERFGNASSVHRRGEAAREALEEARARVAALIGASPEEIVFTTSGSEANNLALQGTMLNAVQALATPRGAPRRRLVVSAIEHLSVLETARQLGARGFAVTV